MKDENMNNNQVEAVEENSNSALKELIERLLIDENYKAMYMQDPDAAMQEYDLSESQRLLLKSLDKEDIEKLSPENIEEFFSADSAVYTPDLDEDLDREENKAQEDDIL